MRTNRRTTAKDRLRIAAVGLALAAVILSGCAADNEGDSEVAGVVAPVGFEILEVLDRLAGPTQMNLTPDGDLVVAELVGEENDGVGRILLIDDEELQIFGNRPETAADRVVLQDNLNKPTGVAVVGETLWFMERDRLTFSALTPGAERFIYRDAMPNNGRSEGSLTVTPESALIFNTSGRIRNGEVVEGSGLLFRIPNADPIAGGDPAIAALLASEPDVIASGLKHGYAHVVDSRGTLFVTEMSDGTFDGEQAPDELVAVTDGDDFGWPACIGSREPVDEFGGDGQLCDQTPVSHNVYAERATPISVEVPPWDANQLIVALWNTDQLITTADSSSGTDESSDFDVFITGIGRPQDMLAFGPRLLVLDHEAGRIISIRAK